MKKWIALFCALITVLGMTACGNNEQAPSKEESDNADIAESTTDGISESTESVQNNEDFLQYYNDVAYWFYNGIEMHYNNKFDDAEFVCVINMKDRSWEITNSEEPQGFSAMISDVINDMQVREFESGPKATGTALVKFEYGSLHYVQYTEPVEGSVQIIGQYADPTRIADGHIQWGVFHNRTRCDICSNS